MQISYLVCTFDAQNLINSSVCGHAHTHQVSSSYVLRNLRYRVHKVCDADDAMDAPFHFSSQADKDANVISPNVSQSKVKKKKKKKSSIISPKGHVSPN